MASTFSTGPATVGSGAGKVPRVHRHYRNPVGQSGEQSLYQATTRGHQDQGHDHQKHAEGEQEDAGWTDDAVCLPDHKVPRTAGEGEDCIEAAPSNDKFK